MNSVSNFSPSVKQRCGTVTLGDRLTAKRSDIKARGRAAHPGKVNRCDNRTPQGFYKSAGDIVQPLRDWFCIGHHTPGCTGRPRALMFDRSAVMSRGHGLVGLGSRRKR